MTRVIYGGVISDRKGVNLPDTVIAIPALTQKDRADLDAAASLGVDWIALSFVQRPDDVAEARKLIRGRAGVMAKIEKPSALGCLDELLEISDGIMVARGDLGVELPIETGACPPEADHQGRTPDGPPGRRRNPDARIDDRRTRADPRRSLRRRNRRLRRCGRDHAVGRKCRGSWPDKAVAMMDRIAQSVEQDSLHRQIINAQRTEPEPTSADAISAAARQVAETLNLSAIVCYTGSGSTGLRVSRERPEVPIIALTPSAATARRLTLAWGLHTVLTEDAQDLDDMVKRACRIASVEGFAQPDQRIIITAGVPLGTPGATNMLRIAYVGRESV